MRNLSQQSISNQMIFLRIAVRLLTIAVHKEMIFRNVNPLFQTANVGFYATAIISNQSAINQQLIRVSSLLYPKWDCS